MYKKQLYVFHGDRPIPAIIRNYEEKDIDALIRIQQESFPPPFPSGLWWNKEQLMNHITLFPEGALCVEVDGEVVGSMTGLIVNFHPSDADHTWEEITDIFATITETAIRYTSSTSVSAHHIENSA